MFERVLLVEDDAVTAFLTRRVLQTNGAFKEVVTVTDGQEAIDYLSETHVDLIVLDLSMPGLNGFDFLKRYREEYERSASKPIPVLILSSSIFPDDREKAKTFANVVEYGLKPLTENLLEKVLRQIKKSNS